MLLFWCLDRFMKIAIGLLGSCGNANASLAVIGSSSKIAAIGTGSAAVPLVMLALPAPALYTSTYFAVQAFRSGGLEKPTIVWQSGACADCQHHELQHRSVLVASHRVILPGAAIGYPNEHGHKEFHQPFIRDDDEDGSRESSECKRVASIHYGKLRRR